jgi:predicted regulator of Ras-like GTPase activity (Roadblock/LC7/MglB family)
VLEPLALVPGVRLTAIVSEDGVPIASMAGARRKGEAHSPVHSLDSDEAMHSFAALTSGWVGDMLRSVGQLSWGSPRRLVLSASHGSLTVHQGPGALLLVLVDKGITPEQLRVPMDGAVARMQRLLRGLGSSESEPAHPEPPGIFPSSSEPTGDSAPPLTHNQPSEIRGEN